MKFEEFISIEVDRNGIGRFIIDWEGFIKNYDIEGSFVLDQNSLIIEGAKEVTLRGKNNDLP